MASEFELIKRYFSRPAGRRDVLLGVGDDAAVLDVPAGQKLVAAIDTIVEGVHFPEGTSAEAIGHRALAVNLSDLAAMGATPAWATLSLSLPSADASWLEQFARGLYRLADRFALDIVGGDTVRGPLSISISIMGWVESDRWLRRSGAKPGDLLFISGTPGEAAAGLALLQKQAERSVDTTVLVDRFLWPEPRVDLGRAIRSLASAAIDVSDGMLADLRHMCEQSGCGARIDLESLPFGAAFSSSFELDDRERFALSGGDDYELLFTLPPDRVESMKVATAGKIQCTAIGTMTNSRSIVCYRGGAEVEVPQRGYDHFADGHGG